MNIKCLAENYETVELSNNLTIVYNNLYKSSNLLLFLVAFSAFLIPDTYSFNAPIAILLKENGGSEVTIDKKLNVSGTADFEKILIKSHYEKWKKTHLIANIFLILLAFAAFVFLGYIAVFKSDFSPITCLCTLVLFAIFVYLCLKLKKQTSMIKKLKIEDFNI